MYAFFLQKDWQLFLLGFRKRYHFHLFFFSCHLFFSIQFFGCFFVLYLVIYKALKKKQYISVDMGKNWAISSDARVVFGNIRVICRHCSAPEREQCRLCSAHVIEPCRLCSAHGAETKFEGLKNCSNCYFCQIYIFFKTPIFKEFIWPLGPLLRKKLFWWRVPLIRIFTPCRAQFRTQYFLVYLGPPNYLNRDSPSQTI